MVVGVFPALSHAPFLSTHPSPAPAPAAHCGLYGTVATSKPHCGVRARVGEAPLRLGPGGHPGEATQKTSGAFFRGWGWGPGEGMYENTGNSPSKIPRSVTRILTARDLGSKFCLQRAKCSLCSPHPAPLALAAQKYWHWEECLPILAELLQAGW